MSQSGSSVMNFSLAVIERVKNGDEWTDYTNWVDCVIFGNRCDFLSKVLHKGSKVAVNGKLRYSTWERDGQKRSKLEVIVNDLDFMTPRQDGQPAPHRAPQHAPHDVHDEDVPF